MDVGTIAEINRYAVKSMLGESLQTTPVGESGIPGDRAYALVDIESGKIASAKDPRKWAQLLGFRCVYDGEVDRDAFVITLPDGTQVRATARDVDAVVSAACGRQVRLSADTAANTYDYVWEVEGIAPEEVVSGSQIGTTDEGAPISTMPAALMAPGTFQDVAPLTLITTSALRAMKVQYPEGDWSPARFRMNLLIDTDSAIDTAGIVENTWPGQRLRIGGVELEVTAPAPRCVMTTLPQSGLPRDRGILRTVAAHNRQEFGSFGIWACLGVYANVVTPGSIGRGDRVELL
jgi:MOSC domain-containing protein